MLPEPRLEPMFRATTEALSMPMTILWAPENLNLDDSWTRKNVYHYSSQLFMIYLTSRST